MSRLNDWFNQLDGLTRGYIASKFPGCKSAYEKNSGALDGRVLEMHDLLKELPGQPENLQVFLESNVDNIIQGMTKTDCEEMLQGSVMRELFPMFKPNMSRSLGMRQKEILIKDMAVYAKSNCPVFWDIIVEHNDVIPDINGQGVQQSQPQPQSVLEKSMVPVTNVIPPTNVQDQQTSVSFPGEDSTPRRSSIEWIQWYSNTGLYAQLLLEEKFPGTHEAAESNSENPPATLVEMYGMLYQYQAAPEEIDDWLASSMMVLADQCELNQDEVSVKNRVESHPYYKAIREGRSPYKYIPIVPSIRETANSMSMERSKNASSVLALLESENTDYANHPVQKWFFSAGPLTKSYVNCHWPIMKAVWNKESILNFSSDEVQKWIDAMVAENVTDENLDDWCKENASDLIYNLEEEDKHLAEFPIPFPNIYMKTRKLKDELLAADPAFLDAIKGDPSGLPVCEQISERKSVLKRLHENDEDTTERDARDEEETLAILNRASTGENWNKDASKDSEDEDDPDNTDTTFEEDEFDEDDIDKPAPKRPKKEKKPESFSDEEEESFD